MKVNNLQTVFTILLTSKYNFPKENIIDQKSLYHLIVIISIDIIKYFRLMSSFNDFGYD